jgi:hypothetical protein
MGDFKAWRAMARTSQHSTAAVLAACCMLSWLDDCIAVVWHHLVLQFVCNPGSMLVVSLQLPGLVVSLAAADLHPHYIT